MTNTPAILFLCTGNYYRSRFAEILLSSLSRDAGLPWVGISRGLKVVEQTPRRDAIDDRVIVRLRELGIEDRLRESLEPRQLVSADFELAQLHIALEERVHKPMMCSAFPRYADRVRYWRIKDRTMTAAYDPLTEITSHVSELVSNLNAQMVR